MSKKSRPSQQKLNLQKTTVRTLSNEQLGGVAGGDTIWTISGSSAIPHKIAAH